MAQIPYSPYPQAEPTLESGLVNQRSTGATPEAFGAGIGKAVEGIGDVFAKHAIHMQDEANAAHAKDMFLGATTELAELDNQFRMKEGADAASSFPQFAKDAAAIREKYRANAPNGAVAKLFDNDFARRATFTIIDGSRYASTQNKAYQRATSTAIVKSAEADAGTSPDPDRIEGNIQTANDAIASEASGRDPPEKIAFEQRLSTSRILSQAIESQAITDPDGARKLFEANRGRIFPETRNRIDSRLQAAETNLGAKNDAQDYVEGRIKGLTPMELTPKWLAEAQQRAREDAKEKHPENPAYEQALVSNITSRWHQDDQVKNKLMTEQKNQVLGVAAQAKSIDQIILDPVMGKAYYDQVERDPTFAGKVQRMVINNNKADNTPTKDRAALNTELKGMLLTDEGRKQFATYDLEKADLTESDRQKFRLEQLKLAQKGQNQIKLQQVLTYPEVRSQLNAAGVIRGKPDTDEARRYDTFIGVLSEQVQAFEQEKKRLPNETESKAMIAPMLRKQAIERTWNPATWFGTPTAPLFKEVPSSVRDEAVKRYKERYGEEPPEGLIEREWVKSQLKTRP